MFGLKGVANAKALGGEAELSRETNTQKDCMQVTEWLAKHSLGHEATSQYQKTKDGVSPGQTA